MSTFQCSRSAHGWAVADLVPGPHACMRPTPRAGRVARYFCVLKNLPFHILLVQYLSDCRYSPNVAAKLMIQTMLQALDSATKVD